MQIVDSTVNCMHRDVLKEPHRNMLEKTHRYVLKEFHRDVLEKLHKDVLEESHGDIVARWLKMAVALFIAVVSCMCVSTSTFANSSRLDSELCSNICETFPVVDDGFILDEQVVSSFSSHLAVINM